MSKPVTEHWIPHDQASACFLCKLEFNNNSNSSKTNCRACGKVFCSNCAKASATLPEEFGYGSVPQPCCVNCYSCFVDTPSQSSSSSNSAQSTSTSTSTSVGTSNSSNSALNKYIDAKTGKPLESVNIKVMILGDSGAGKTSLFLAFNKNICPPEYNPTIIDEYDEELVFENKIIKLQFIDTAGQEDYALIRKSYFPKTDVILLAFSVMNPSSFDRVTSKFIKEIRHNAPEAAVLLVGLKCDLREDKVALAQLQDKKQTPITKKMAEKVAKEIKAIGYVECSAQTQIGVKEVFDRTFKVITRKGKLFGIF